MRNKLLSILLISSFLLGSLPAFAQEVPSPVETVETEQAPAPETPVSLEEAPIEVLTADETPTGGETPVVAPAPPVEEEAVLPESVQTLDLQVADIATENSSTSESVVAEAATSTEVVYVEIEGSITLSNGCTATDATGQAHIFEPGSHFLAICALVEAEEAGIISDFEFEDMGWGFMLTSIEGVSPGPSEFWELRHNGEQAMVGVKDLEVARGDTLTFTRTDWSTIEEEVYDRVTIHVESVLYDVTVPSQCTATATNGTTYTFPLEASAAYFALCAFVEAREEGMISDLAFDYYSPGAFISKVNETASNGPVFWALWHNDVMAEVGAEALEIEVGDTLSLRYSDATSSWPPVELDERYDFRIIGLEQAGTGTSTDETGGGTGGNGSETPDDGTFDFTAAYDFLETEQNEDGSWDSELVTAWAAFALAAQGPAGMKSSLTSYFREEEPDFASVRDYERHAMALMALNINPYTGGPDDYIAPIVESFDGTQIDDDGLVNDDIFALIPLLHAGYTKEDDMIRKITAFIVSEQKDNGSWENSVDVTGAAMQALSGLRSLPGVSSALMDAQGFLRDSQENDGGFGDPFATSWAIQGIEAVGQSAETWAVGDETPLTYLVSVQEDDGGLTTTPDDYSTRAWATAYAIPAVKGLTWDDLMRDFKKPAVTGGKNTEDDEEEKTEEIATTTDAILPEAEILVVEPLMSTTSVPTFVETAEAAEITEIPIFDTEEEEVVEETPTPAPQPAAVGSTGAWEWLKKLFSSIWRSVTGIF